ncbi:hypothetical protein COO60DRAFT_1289482 [Scenedesmus sp. NREL 46B-D3]|nr:hypothetical protein COO60DRAFT_1289482 [Scenedesmus sp. NREL 46B-D3]
MLRLPISTRCDAQTCTRRLNHTRRCNMASSVNSAFHNQHSGQGLTHPHQRHSGFPRHLSRAQCGVKDDAVAAGTRMTIDPADASLEEALHIVEESLHERAALCDSGLPDPDMCLIPEAEEEPPKELPVWDEAVTRGRWLLGLLVLQSTSSFVLDSYQDLLKDHIVVTLFLTMLVGAGGNAGNQSAIKVIRGLATGSITTSWNSIKTTMTEQLEVALLLGGGLAAAGFVRVYLTNGSLLNSYAISVSLMAIVMASVILGSGLPFCLARIGVDPAHAGTSIQVLMDILGVAITCGTCQFVLVQYADSLG